MLGKDQNEHDAHPKVGNGYPNLAKNGDADIAAASGLEGGENTCGQGNGEPDRETGEGEHERSRKAAGDLPAYRPAA
jgi:hypothetical protein